MAQLASPPSGTPGVSWLQRFGRRLLIARGRAGLTQQALGSPDLSKSFISLLESGRSHPSVETVVSLARRVNTSIASLLLDQESLRLETALNLVHLASQMDLTVHGPEAVTLVDAAQALIPDMPADLRGRVALLRARASLAAQRLDEARQHADDALDLARRHRFPHLIGVALWLKGDVELRRRSFKAALAFLEDATTTLRHAKASRTDENIRALISLGTTRFQLGQVDRAQRAYARALELGTRLGVHGLCGRAYMGLGIVAWTRRQLDTAVDLLTQARSAFERIEDRTELSRALGNLGLVLREQGRLDDALTALQQALRVQEQLAVPRDRSATLDEIALVYLALDRHSEAERTASRAITDAQAGHDQAREAACRVTLARIVRARGRQQEAIELLRGVVSTLTRLGMQQRAVSAAGELGLLLREVGADAEAARYLAMALGPTRKDPTSIEREFVLEGLSR